MPCMSCQGSGIAFNYGRNGQCAVTGEQLAGVVPVTAVGVESMRMYSWHYTWAPWAALSAPRTGFELLLAC